MRETTDARPRRRAIGPRARALIATAALVACARPARAIDTYTGPSGNWSTGSNWQTGMPPGNKDTVFVQGTSGGNNTITFDAPAATATNLAALTITGATNIGSTTLLQNGGSITAGTMTLGGTYGIGNVALSGGSQSLTTLTIFGSNAAGISTFTLGPLGFLTAVTENVGANHLSGKFVQNGGTNDVDNLNIGGGDVPGVWEYDLSAGNLQSFAGTSSGTLKISNPNSVVQLNQTGGSITFGQILVGNGSSGTFNLSGGSGVTAARETVYGFPALFSQSGSENDTPSLTITSGTYALSGTGHLIAATATLNGPGAKFLQSGGTATIGTLQLQSGIASLTGGSLTINNVTSTGSGTFSLSGGVLTTGTATINNYIQTGGTHVATALTIDGFSSSFSRGLLTTGTNGAKVYGAITQSGGAFQTGVLYVDFNAAYTLSGTATVQASELQGGFYKIQGGNAKVTVTGDAFLDGYTGFASGGGTLSVGGTAHVGYADGVRPINSDGTIDLAAGTLSAGAGLVLGEARAGTINISGTGAVTAPAEDVGYTGSGTINHTAGNNTTGALSLGTRPGSFGTYEFRGGTLSVGSGTGTVYIGNAGRGQFDEYAGALTFDALYAGFATNSLGSLSVWARLTTARQMIGVGGAGTLTVVDGATNSASTALSLGDLATGSGTCQVFNGQLMAPLVTVGNAGRGTLVVGRPTLANDFSTGTVSISQALIVGHLPTATGACTVSGKSFVSAANVYLGGDAAGPGGTGALALVGGTTTISGTFRAYNTAYGTNVTGVTMSAGSLAAATFVNDAPFRQTGGSATFGPVSGTGSFVVGGGTAGALLSLARFAQASLSVGSGGLVRVLADPQNIYTNTAAVTLTGTGTLDLNNHDLLTPTPASTIAAYLASGYTGGAWNGTNGGIVSTAAAKSAAPRGLAYATAADLTAGNIPAGQTLVTYTVPGDADLSGAVDFNDFLSLQNGYGSTGDWAQGDFNYDGVVDYRDYLILQADYGLSLTGGTPTPAPQLAVPEPASLSLLGLTATALLARRRRSRQSLG